MMFIAYCDFFFLYKLKKKRNALPVYLFPQLNLFQFHVYLFTIYLQGVVRYKLFHYRIDKANVTLTKEWK